MIQQQVCYCQEGACAGSPRESRRECDWVSGWVHIEPALIPGENTQQSVPCGRTRVLCSHSMVLRVLVLSFSMPHVVWMCCVLHVRAAVLVSALLLIQLPKVQ